MMRSTANLFIRRLAFILLPTFLALGTPLSRAASFECSKARTPVEQGICLDEGLSSLDEVMVSEYRQVLSASTAPESVRQSQRDWLRLVRNACVTLECLRTAYEARIVDLRGGNASHLTLTGSIQSVYAGLDALSPGATYGRAAASSSSAARWLASNKVLETILELAVSSSKLPPRLKVSAQNCGQANAFYFASKNAAILCYELVQSLYDAHAARVSPSEKSSSLVESRRLAAAAQFAVLHEIGHGILTLKGDGYFGRQETGADAFATVVLLRNIKTEQEVTDALWGVWTMYQLFGKSQMHPSDEHEYSDQRWANFACLVVGKAPGFRAQFVTNGQLLQTRAERCPMEWDQATRALLTASR